MLAFEVPVAATYSEHMPSAQTATRPIMAFQLASDVRHTSAYHDCSILMEANLLEARTLLHQIDAEVEWSSGNGSRKD